MNTPALISKALAAFSLIVTLATVFPICHCLKNVDENDQCKSVWVYLKDGKLKYNTTMEGDKIMDFSYAGYHQGRNDFKNPLNGSTLSPSGGDDTDRIQEKLHEGGKITLLDGEYRVSKTLTIKQSNTFLTGSKNTIIHFNPPSTTPTTQTTNIVRSNSKVLRVKVSSIFNLSQDIVIENPNKTNLDCSGRIVYKYYRRITNITGDEITVNKIFPDNINVGSKVYVQGPSPTFLNIVGGQNVYGKSKSTEITDHYVPSGSNVFHVEDPYIFDQSKGNRIMIEAPNKSGLLNKDNNERHRRVVYKFDRMTKNINVEAREITIDVPFSDSVGKRFGNTTVYLQAIHEINEVGVENLTVISNGDSIFITFTNIRDAWVRNVKAENFQSSGIRFNPGSKQITLLSVELNTSAQNRPAPDSQISVEGSLILVDNCRTCGDGMYSFVTQARTTGPNVVKNFDASGSGSHIMPHLHWATGLLVEKSSVTGGGNIRFMNRSRYGTGQGWPIGWGVIYNSATDGYLTVQEPPQGNNWAIGSSGKEDSRNRNTGIVECLGKNVLPDSLYQTQFHERKKIPPLKFCSSLRPTPLQELDLY